jgi:hypothetical protein
MKKSPVALAVAVMLFVGWLTWLGIQALRDRNPIVVSRAQLAVSQYDVEADLQANPDGSLPLGVKVAGVRWAADGQKPAERDEITVVNLNATQGFRGNGKYLLPLVRYKGREKEFEVAGLPLDPGYPPLKEPPKPRIYPVTPGVLKQWDEIRGP